MSKYTAMIDTIDETDELYLLVWEDGGDPQPKYQWKLSAVVETMKWSGHPLTWTNAISPDAGMPQRGVKGK